MCVEGFCFENHIWGIHMVIFIKNCIINNLFEIIIIKNWLEIWHFFLCLFALTTIETKTSKTKTNLIAHANNSIKKMLKFRWLIDALRTPVNLTYHIYLYLYINSPTFMYGRCDGCMVWYTLTSHNVSASFEFQVTGFFTFS